METETLTVAELREQGRLAVHVVFEGEAKRLVAAHDRPGMRVRVRCGEIEQELGLASPPGEQPAVLLERATPIAQAIEQAGAGAPVEVSEPFGWGVPLEAYEGCDLYLVGHGAGLGPVRAVALAALAEPGRFRTVHILCEAHFLNDLPYRDEYPLWQRHGARVYQLMQRPDMGKWRDAEAAYIYEELADMAPDPSRALVFAAGPEELLSGVAGVMRRIELDPDRLYLCELPTIAPERALPVERLKALLDKISLEGTFGSGHQADAPDHGPVYRTPHEQPSPRGLPPYKRAKELAHGGH